MVQETYGEIVDAVREACEELGYDARSYSGRGMYGRACLGIALSRDVSAAEAVFRIAAHLVETDRAGLIEELSAAEWREDSLGLGRVMYAPGIAWVEDDCDRR